MAARITEPVNVAQRSSESPIFVVGAPRSGTTLLQGILAQSPDTFSLPETHLFSSVLPRLNKGVADRLSWDELLQASAALQTEWGLQIKDESLAPYREAADNGDLTARDLFEMVTAQYRPEMDKPGRLRVVEKTPEHVEYMADIMSIYPAAKFIHIIRDPRNTISSWMAAPFARSRWIPFYTYYWRLALIVAANFGRQYPDSLLTVSYEQVVQQPEEIVQQVCAFAGIAFRPEMLRVSGETSGAIVQDAEIGWKKSVSREFYYEPEAWRKRLTAVEAWIIERQTGKEMQEYGYGKVMRVRAGEKIRAYRGLLRMMRRDGEARNLCLWLVGRCRLHGDMSGARRLALYAAAGDWRLIRNRSFLRDVFL